MTKRVLAVAAAVVVAVVVGSGLPASAQTYPPPVRSITVDDTTPAPGQPLTITLRTCRPGTFALLGIDLKLVATPTVGAGGAAQATVTLSSRVPPGRHIVSGACLTPDLDPLFLSTVITVEGRAGTEGPGNGGGGGGAGGGAGTGPGTGSAGGGAGSGPGSGSAGPAGERSGGPSLAALAGPGLPADARDLFGGTAAANGIAGGGATGDVASEDGGLATAQRSGSTSPEPESADSDPGLLATIARVTLGVAALAGVPVALAISRRPRRAIRQGFA